MSRSRLKFGFLVLISWVCWLIPQARASTVIVAPNANGATEGNGNNSFPFNISAVNSVSSERYQQVFAASQFSALGGPRVLTEIRFRPDGTCGAAFSSTLSSIQIARSTTATAPDALSNTFAINVGANDTVVRSGALTISSAFTGPVGGPKDFDIIIPLTTSFTYNPAAGNLLLDVRNFGAGLTTVFDIVNTPSDSVSRVFTNATGNVNSTTGDATTSPDSGGLVAQFVFADATVVPVPAAAPVGGVLLIMLAVARRRLGMGGIKIT